MARMLRSGCCQQGVLSVSLLLMSGMTCRSGSSSPRPWSPQSSPGCSTRRSPSSRCELWNPSRSLADYMCSQSRDCDISADTQLAGPMVCAAEGSTAECMLRHGRRQMSGSILWACPNGTALYHGGLKCISPGIHVTEAQKGAVVSSSGAPAPWCL